MPKKVHDCVEEVKKQKGKSESDAWAICTDSVKNKDSGRFPEFTREAQEDETPFQFRELKKRPRGLEFPDEGFEDLPTLARETMEKVLKLQDELELAQAEALEIQQQAQAKIQELREERGLAEKEEELRELTQSLGEELSNPELDEVIYELLDVLILVENKTETKERTPSKAQEYDVVMEKIKEIGGNVSRSVTQTLNNFRKKQTEVKEEITRRITVFPRPEIDYKKQKPLSSHYRMVRKAALVDALRGAWQAAVEFVKDILGLKDDVAELRALVETL